MPATAAPAKKGIRNYLITYTGLRPSDEVTVRSGTLAPDEILPGDLVVLGDVTAPQIQAGLQVRASTPTMTCWVIVTRPGDDEAAIDAARDRADALYAGVEAAMKADPSAAGTVTQPGRVVATSSGLEDSPVSWDGVAARRCTVPFSLSWTSHVG